jgi:hypothetical protein
MKKTFVVLALILAPTLLAKKGSVTGHAIVKLDAPAPCVAVRGLTDQDTVQGCTHANCTAAKHNAANKLRARVPADCRRYVKETGGCDYNGCR